MFLVGKFHVSASFYPDDEWPLVGQCISINHKRKDEILKYIDIYEYTLTCVYIPFKIIYTTARHFLLDKLSDNILSGKLVYVIIFH